MLDTNKQFVEEFSKLSNEEQVKRVAEMPMYMVDVLVHNGFKIYARAGEPVVEKIPETKER